MSNNSSLDGESFPPYHHYTGPPTGGTDYNTHHNTTHHNTTHHNTTHHNITYRITG